MTDGDEQTPIRYEVIFHPGADEDIHALYERILQTHGPLDALRYVGRVKRTAKELQLFPRRGTLINHPTEEVRSIPSHDGRYRLIFRIDEASRIVQIVYVASRLLPQELPRLDQSR